MVAEGEARERLIDDDTGTSQGCGRQSDDDGEQLSLAKYTYIPRWTIKGDELVSHASPLCKTNPCGLCSGAYDCKVDLIKHQRNSHIDLPADVVRSLSDDRVEEAIQSRKDVVKRVSKMVAEGEAPEFLIIDDTRTMQGGDCQSDDYDEQTSSASGLVGSQAHPVEGQSAPGGCALKVGTRAAPASDRIAMAAGAVSNMSAAGHRRATRGDADVEVRA